MAELNQQMSIEHRNRRKTQEYYRKLVEATKASSKGMQLLIGARLIMVREYLVTRTLMGHLLPRTS